MAEPYNTAPAKPWQPVDSIPLAEAVLCANCNCVTRAKNGHCPVCESGSVINLAALLDGKEQSATEAQRHKELSETEKSEFRILFAPVPLCLGGESGGSK